MSKKNPGHCNTNNAAVIRWVEEQAKLCQPDHIFWCDGSEAEKELLTAEAVEKGILVQRWGSGTFPALMASTREPVTVSLEPRSVE